MKYQYVEPKTRPTKKKLKLPSILGPFVGAFIGFTSFMCLTSPYLLLDRFPNSYVLLAFLSFDAVLLGPGILALKSFNIFVDILPLSGFAGKIIFIVVVFGVSSIPLTLIGLLIGSYNKILRIIGIIFLMLYGLGMTVGSVFWLNMWSA